MLEPRMQNRICGVSRIALGLEDIALLFAI